MWTRVDDGSRNLTHDSRDRLDTRPMTHLTHDSWVTQPYIEYKLAGGTVAEAHPRFEKWAVNIHGEREARAYIRELGLCPQ
jgi:hypothetical protein